MTVTEIPSAGSDLAPNTGGKLAGQVALVTGGTRGIGAAICRSLACQGAELAAGYAGNAAKAEAFLAGMAEEYSGRHVTTHQGDIGTADDCRRMVEEVVEQHGRLDILVNNAGITADRQVLRMPDEDWCRVLNVNLSGASFTHCARRRWSTCWSGAAAASSTSPRSSGRPATSGRPTTRRPSRGCSA